MLDKKKQYFIVGDRPVFTSPDNNADTYVIYAFDWETGNFKPAIEYLSRIFFSKRDDVEEVSEIVFNEKVAFLIKKMNS